MGIRELIRKFEEIQNGIGNVPAIIDEVVIKEQNVLLSLNKDQMLLGRNVNGDPFSPGYLEDPYFDTPEQAQAYAKRKYALESKHNARIENPTIYPNKGKDVPNLIVTGPFQDNMFILVENQNFMIGSTYQESRDIEIKYNNLVFGISPESKAFFYRNYLHPALLKLLKR